MSAHAANAIAPTTSRPVDIFIFTAFSEGNLIEDIMSNAITATINATRSGRNIVANKECEIHDSYSTKLAKKNAAIVVGNPVKNEV